MDSMAATDQKGQAANRKPQAVVGLHVESIQIAGKESSFKNEAESQRVEKERQAVLEYGQQIDRVNKALVGLKSKLTQMREDDLSLLKRLIRIGDNIRRLSRHRHRYADASTSLGHHQRTQDLMTSAADLSVTLRRFQGGRESLLTDGDPFHTVPLLRRQSAPQVCTLGLLGSTSSRPGSTCSTDWVSDDMMDIGSSDDGIDSVDSEDDILEDDSFDTLTWRGPRSQSRALAYSTSAQLTADISFVASDVSRLFGHSNIGEASTESVLNIPADIRASAPPVPIFFTPKPETRAAPDLVNSSGSTKEDFCAVRLRKSSKDADTSYLAANEKSSDLSPVLCQRLDPTCTKSQKRMPDSGNLNVPARLSWHDSQAKVDGSTSRITRTPHPCPGTQRLQGESELSESRHQGTSSFPDECLPLLPDSSRSRSPKGDHIDRRLVGDSSGPGSTSHPVSHLDGTSAQKHSPSITVASGPNSAVDRDSSKPSSTPLSNSPAFPSSRPRSMLEVPLRKKSHSVVAETFLGGGRGQDAEGLSGTYSVILRQNVKLWKERLGQANSVRQRISVLEEES